MNARQYGLEPTLERSSRSWRDPAPADP